MRASSFVFAASVVLLAPACGSVAGNPKKPKEPPPAGQVRFTLPSVDFDFDDATVADDSAGLQLAGARRNLQGLGGPLDKALFNDPARRLLKIVRQVNRVSDSMNEILEGEDGIAEGETLRFAGKGQKLRLSGKIGPVSDAPYAYEAVLCDDGRPLRRFRWSEDGQAIQLTQDLSVAVGDAGSDAHVSLVSRLTVEERDGVAYLDLASSGSWENLDVGGAVGDGGGIVERTLVERDGETMRLRSVLDRFEGDMPAEFEGERYVVGRMTSGVAARAAQPLKPYDVDFVGWGKHVPRTACKGGAFPESAADLWQVDGDGPEFCVGRRRGAKRFSDLDEFAAHVAGLEPIGIVGKSQLIEVAMPDGLGCE